MIGLLQRVRSAEVRIAGEQVAAIDTGLLVLVGVARDDDERRARRLLERLLGYRVFPDAAGRMNLDLHQARGGLILVPQFTLLADTRKGARPSLSRAAPPALGAALFDYLTGQAREAISPFGAGRFGADMQVGLVNDGPVTFWLEA